MVPYTARQSISRNSFHSVATTTASLFCAAERAESAIVTCFLTEKKEVCQVKWATEGGGRTLLEGHVWKSLGKIEPDLRYFDFGIINCDACTLGKEITNEGDGG